MRWVIERFRYCEPDREQTLRRVVAGKPLMAAAFDGPLRGDLRLIGRYRRAESLLTSHLWRLIGKPGQASAPIGRKLNIATNEAASIVLSFGLLGSSSHSCSIHSTAIVEAFPSSFLGLMLADPTSMARGRKGKSDRFFVTLVADGTVSALLQQLLPGRSVGAIASISNHDDRAAFVCALTALCAAAGEFCAVGNEDGWIILPPRTFIADWAWDLLSINAAESGGLVDRAPV